MSSESGTQISKPVQFWRKPPKINFKDLFKSLSKAAIDGVSGKWEQVAKDAVDAITAIGWAKTPEEMAWLLVYSSLTQAMISLVQGNQELFFEKPNESDLEQLCDHLNNTLESLELRIDQNFFSRPKDLPILKDIKTAFVEWLQSFKLNQAQADTISDRLPSYFVFALHEEWAKQPDNYACLKEEVNTPFTQANEREHAWLRYLAWLQKQVEEPMFLETFGLKQVYVRLRAYYKLWGEDEKDKQLERRVIEADKNEQIVIDLEDELEAWLNKCDRHDAIRVISGGPGSGKSSFTKIFAANQAEKGNISVLFIPLHHFDLASDLINAVGKFVRDDGFLRYNPLEQDQAESRLLIIFDGLDELAMQGKLATNIAQEFVREVQRKVERFNQRETRLQVLISGRELVVQANSSDFRQPQQILHILPYFITKDERRNYIDTQNLLEQDQRQVWWLKYGNSTGKEYNDLPQELNNAKLTDITAQPLLNYLVALSFIRGKIKFSEDSNLNDIYEDLLKAVYERAWTGYQHPSLQGIKEQEFVRILEEIALAAWHGDGRTTTVKEIEMHCDNSGLKSLLERFQEGAKLGVTRLLTAFYFRESGFKEGDKTFEFTHKTFGEYLTARRIVRETRRIHEMLQRRQHDPDEGWDEREALCRWAILCGATAMDKDLFSFICDEIRLQNPSDVSNLQQTLCHLIGFMLRHGMPMERLNPRPNFQEENRQACNAEEALLAVLNSCARVTKKVSEIKWHTDETLGAWISRIQSQRPIQEVVLAIKCLSFLNLQGSNLMAKDLWEAELGGSILSKVNFINTILIRANLEGANLQEANLEEANLEEANLEEANLERTNLQEANLEGANLQEANLQEANLQEANLQEANLQEANLQGANLQEANLDGAYLDGANLEEADFEGTILEDEDLSYLDDDLASDSNE